MASESRACETSAHSAIECVKDNESSSPDVDVLRANITDERQACSWVEDYGLKTNTSWVVDFVKPTAKCERPERPFWHTLTTACHQLKPSGFTSKLLVQEDGYALVANSAVNPLPAAIYYWHRLWREKNFGRDVDPLLKIAEKMPLYAKHGVDVKLDRSEDGQYWVVLVATPIMRRAQLLNAATEIIFIDSTSSCDTSRSTVTVLLAATNAGAVPIAVLIHNSQSTQGYCTAFTLMKDSFPTCFGGLSIMYADSPEKLEEAMHNLEERDTINAQGEQHNPVPQDEMAANTPPQDEEMPDSEAVLDTESCASISHLEQQESEDADNSLEALIEQLRRVHAEEKSNAAYRRHLLSGTKCLRRLQEQKRGVGAMVAMDAALGAAASSYASKTADCQHSPARRGRLANEPVNLYVASAWPLPNGSPHGLEDSEKDRLGHAHASSTVSPLSKTTSTQLSEGHAVGKPRSFLGPPHGPCQQLRLRLVKRGPVNRGFASSGHRSWRILTQHFSCHQAGNDHRWLMVVELIRRQASARQQILKAMQLHRQ
ncbi:hypothetical protein MRX96_050680 [Rhipicephalus microplus]